MNPFPDFSTPYQYAYAFANGEQMLSPAELAASAQMVGPEGLTHSHFIASQLVQETKALPETSLDVASPLATTNQSTSPFYRYPPQFQHPPQHQCLPETEGAGYQANYSYSLPQFGYANQQYAQYVPNAFDARQEANAYLNGSGASGVPEITAQEAQRFLNPNAVFQPSDLSLALASATNGYPLPQRWSPSPTPPLTDTSSLPSSVNPTPLATPYSRDVNNIPLPNSNGNFWASSYVPTENIAGPSRLPMCPPPYMLASGPQFGTAMMLSTVDSVPPPSSGAPFDPAPTSIPQVRSSSRTINGKTRRTRPSVRVTSKSDTLKEKTEVKVKRILDCPYSWCPKKYTDPSSLRRHCKGPDHENKLHPCPNPACISGMNEEGFTRMEKLKKHMKHCCP